MDLMTAFLIIGLFAMVWYVVTSLLIYKELQKRGVKMNFLLLRMFIIKYASHYKEITRKETGKTGPLFYHWIISINIALLMMLLIILFRFG